MSDDEAVDEAVKQRLIVGLSVSLSVGEISWWCGGGPKPMGDLLSL